jgi:hypothetical protein
MNNVIEVSDEEQFAKCSKSRDLQVYYDAGDVEYYPYRHWEARVDGMAPARVETALHVLKEPTVDQEFGETPIG